MSADPIGDVIGAEQALIDALDSGTPESIVIATRALSHALTGVAEADISARDQLDFALRQIDAARARLNYLADRNRARLQTMAAARGRTSGATYNARGRARVTLGNG